jgi:hypothetical protein
VTERLAPTDRAEDETEILVIRSGPGANCSSVGSVIDFLFAAGVVGGALLVAVTAALADEAKPAPESEDDANQG